MSKLNQPRIVDMTLAAAIGLNEALIFNQLDYWFEKVKGKNVRGERWVYVTYEQWREQFPIWSTRTIRRTILNLRQIGLITVEMENRLLQSRNSNLHYQIDREHEILIKLGIYTSGQNVHSERTKCPSEVDKMATPINTIHTEKEKQENTYPRYAKNELQKLWTRAKRFMSQKSHLFIQAVDSYIREEMKGRRDIKNPKAYKKTIEVEIWKKETGQPHNTSFEFDEQEEEMKQQALEDRFDAKVVLF